MLATLVITVMLTLPGYGERPAEIERPMPDMATCEAKGRALVRESDDTRRFAFVCRERA